MKRKLILQISFCLAALFCIGGACGYTLAGHAPTWHASDSRPIASLPSSEDAWLEKRYQETVSRVELTGEQAETLRAQYRTLTAEIHAIREDTSRRVTEAFARHRDAVLPALTPDQRKRYEQLAAERRAAHQR
jgi:hypothetical protein